MSEPPPFASHSLRPAAVHSARSSPIILRLSATNPTFSLQGYLAHENSPPSPPKTAVGLQA